MQAYAQLTAQDAEIAAGKDVFSPPRGLSPERAPLPPPRSALCKITDVTPATCCRPLLFHIETALPNGTVCEVSHRFKHFKQLHAYISTLRTPWAARVVKEISLPSGGCRFTSYRLVLRLERLQALRDFLDCLVSDPSALRDPAIADFLGVTPSNEAAPEPIPIPEPIGKLRFSSSQAVWPDGTPQISSSREHSSGLMRIESGFQLRAAESSDGDTPRHGALTQISDGDSPGIPLHPEPAAHFVPEAHPDPGAPPEPEAAGPKLNKHARKKEKKKKKAQPQAKEAAAEKAKEAAA